MRCVESAEQLSWMMKRSGYLVCAATDSRVSSKKRSALYTGMTQVTVLILQGVRRPSTNPFKISAGPVCDPAFQLAFVKHPGRSGQGEFGMLLRELLRRICGVIPDPIRMTAVQIREVTHDPIGRNNI